MKLIYSIDFESWAFPETEDFIHLTSEERKKIDQGYVQESGYRLLELPAGIRVAEIELQLCAGKRLPLAGASGTEKAEIDFLCDWPSLMVS